jgi:desumoylating isopeptidase 1
LVPLRHFRFLTSINSQFTEATYDLIKWNCNHFTNTCLMFLLNKPLDKEYLHQHEPLMATPMGSLIINMLQVRCVYVSHEWFYLLF